MTEIVGIGGLVNKSTVKAGLNLEDVELQIMGKIKESDIRELHQDIDQELLHLSKTIGIDFDTGEAASSSKGGKSSGLDFEFTPSSSKSKSKSQKDKGFDLDFEQASTKSSKYTEDSDSEYSSSSRSSRSSRSSGSSYSGSDSGSEYSESGSEYTDETASDSGSSDSSRHRGRHRSSRKHRDEYKTYKSGSGSRLDLLLGQGKSDLRESGLGGLSAKGVNETLKISDMITEIDTIKYNLAEIGFDTSALPSVQDGMTYTDVERIYKFTTRINDQLKYRSLPEDVIMTMCTGLEKTFTKDTKVFGRFTVDYSGLTSNMKQRMNKISAPLGTIAAKAAEKHGISDAAWILGELVLPLISVPIKNSHESRAPVSNRVTLENVSALDDF